MTPCQVVAMTLRHCVDHKQKRLLFVIQLDLVVTSRVIPRFSSCGQSLSELLGEQRSGQSTLGDEGMLPYPAS